MTQSHMAYKQHRSNGWCRIDMLLALYDAGLGNVEAAIAAAADGDWELSQKHRGKALKIVLELYAGLDFSHGELPSRVGRLCEYMHYVLLHGELGELSGVQSVLASLQEGFRGIREEAIRLEEEGKIPSIDDQHRAGITA